jgi:AraC-like DNA-binding protein
MHSPADLSDAPSVSGSYARSLQAFLASCGLPAGHSGDTPAGIGTRIDGAALGDALRAGGRTLGDPMLGVRFGTRVGCAGFGLLGVAASTATTLGEAVRHLQRFEALTSTLGHVDVRRDGGDVRLSWRPARPVAPTVVEGILAGWVSFGRWLLGEHVPVRGVQFAHARAATLSCYEQALECPVAFGAGDYGVTIAADTLDARPRFADARLNAAIGGWLDGCTLAVEPARGRPATRRVAQWLAACPALDAIDEAAAARALGCSARTLQRRLAGEGARFRALLDAARAQHAIVTLLQEAPRLAQLGADIGFREQSSLCRAFHRWTGYAPLPLKERLAHVFHDLRPVTESPSTGPTRPAASHQTSTDPERTR